MHGRLRRNTQELLGFEGGSRIEASKWIANRTPRRKATRDGSRCLPARQVVGDALTRKRPGLQSRVWRLTPSSRISRADGATRWQVYDWRRRLRRGLLSVEKEDATSPAFVPLTVDDDLQLTTHADLVKVVVGDILIHVGRD
jgi:hypothetical protein